MPVPSFATDATLEPRLRVPLAFRTAHSAVALAPGAPGAPFAPLAPRGPAGPCAPCGPCGPGGPTQPVGIVVSNVPHALLTDGIAPLRVVNTTKRPTVPGAAMSTLTVAPARSIRPLKSFFAFACPDLTVTFFALNGQPLPLQKTWTLTSERLNL